MAWQMKAKITKSIVHLCGIPGCGKTTYARWLERQKGFLHLDFDKLLNGQGPEDQLRLVQALQTKGPKLFVATVRRARRSIAIDWGFPPNSLPLVEALQQEGVLVWWFDGDREAARQSFIKRGDVSVGALDRQMALIQEVWLQIMTVVGPNVINALNRDGSYLPPEEIFEQMFGRDQTP
jgi:hypothetical protein